MKLRMGALIFLVAAVLLSASSCTTGKKKPKCRTCPKWEDSMNLGAELNHHEEKHRSGKRP